MTTKQNSTNQQSFTEKYIKLVEHFLQNPDISQAKKNGFGSGLRVHGKVFAMPAKGKLVVKLPPERIIELTNASLGEPYQYGNKVSKGWFVIASEEKWKTYAEEAFNYVSM